MSRSSKLALAVPPIFLLLGVALGGVSKAVTHDVGKGKQSMELQHLFDAELQYQLGMETVLPAESWEGDLIGSGEGRVTGARIRGTIRWSMYAASCPYRADGRQYPSTGRTDEGDHLCRATPRGFIKTDDGATIWFDAHGFGLRRENANPQWSLTASLRFRTSNPRYLWLNETLAVWEGSFDEKAKRARYHAYYR